MADISRDQFGETKAVLKKIFQNGRYIADADLNEQSDVFINEFRKILSCMVGNQSMRFGDGFKVVGTGASLQVTIKAGFMAAKMAEGKCLILKLASDYNLTGFSTWTGARTDYVYLDVYEDEIDASEDANIVNPDIGEETCVDIRLKYSFEISEGAEPGTPPTGHYYIILASVYKTSGSTIEAGDVTVLVDDFYLMFEPPDGSITTAKLDDGAVTTNKLDADAVTDAKIADDVIHKEHINADIASTGLIQGSGGELKVTGIIDANESKHLKVKRIPMPTWNMDSTASVEMNDLGGIASGKIVVCHAYISTDDYYPQHGIPLYKGGYATINIQAGDLAKVILFREEAGFFDNSNYDGTSHPRGWIIVWYEP